MSKSSKKSRDAANHAAVPKAIVNRLSLYLRELQRLLDNGLETINSGDLGAFLGFTDVQVRKDLVISDNSGTRGSAIEPTSWSGRCDKFSERS